MKKKSAIALIAVLLFQFGCAAYSIDRTSGDHQTPQLDRTASAYICVSEDGKFNSKTYHGSGLATTQIIANNFSTYLSKITKGNAPESYDKTMETALYTGHRYLIRPSIIQWEDHITDTTEIPNKIKIEIVVIDTLSGKQIDSVIIKGKSKISPNAGDTPRDLLRTPVRIYVDSLFQHKDKELISAPLFDS